MPSKKKDDAEVKDGEETTETTETTTTKVDTKADTGKSTTTSDDRRESEREEREPSWLAGVMGTLKGITDTQEKIAEMVKPRETQDGAGVKVRGANHDGTEHQIQTTPQDTKAAVKTPAGTRKLSLFKFRKG